MNSSNETVPNASWPDLGGTRDISRRSVLMSGVAALIGIPLLAACGPTSSANGKQSSGPSAAQGKAKKGGTMRVARPPASNAETLDPASSLSAYEYLGALYNRLVKQAADGTPEPDLATHWESSPDAQAWTLTMRQGVTFHNGKAFTSADAAYTLKHILDPKTGSPQAGVLKPFLTASGISTPDKNTLVLKLNSPNAEFISLLMNYNCYVIPEGSASTIGKSGIGTGPFSLVSFVPAGKGSVKAYDNYFGGTPALDSIVFTAIADVQSRVNALLSGQVDLVAQTNLDFATAQQVRGTTGYTTATVKNAEWYTMPMLCTDAPFTNVAVRQAYKMAYNPKDVIDLSIHGLGTVANNNPVLPTDAYFLDYTVAPDPEKAQSILKKAGLLSKSQTLYTSSYDPVLTPLAEAYQSSVKKAGMNINIQTASADSYYTSIWIKKPFCTSYWYTGRPIDQLLNQIFRNGSSYNESLWSDSKFSSVLDTARRTTDQAKRKQYYQDAQKILVDDSGTIIPFFADRITGLSSKVVNYREYGFEFNYLTLGFADS